MSTYNVFVLKCFVLLCHLQSFACKAFFDPSLGQIAAFVTRLGVGRLQKTWREMAIRRTINWTWLWSSGPQLPAGLRRQRTNLLLCHWIAVYYKREARISTISCFGMPSLERLLWDWVLCQLLYLLYLLAFLPSSFQQCVSAIVLPVIWGVPQEALQATEAF